MRLSPLTILPTLLFSASLAAHSATITYTESAVISGSLNGTSFTNSQIVFIGSADTSLVTVLGGLYQVTIPITGTLAGFGSFSLTGDSFFSSEPGDIAGVVRGSSIILDTYTLALDPYKLVSAIGPLPGPATFSAGGSATSAGTLFITSSGTSTFQAVVATTPEPSSLVLLGTGLLGTGLLGLTSRVRRRLT